MFEANKKIIVYIQAVPERIQYITEYIIPELHKHGFTDTHIMIDYDKNGPMWNFNEIMKKAVQGEEETILVLQDDVILAEYFGQHIRDLDSLNIPVISLFCPPRKKYIEEKNLGTRIYTEKNFLWIPAMLYKKSFMAELYQYSMQNPEKFHDDVLVGRFCKETKNYVRVTIPSLVQHNLTIKSSIGTPAKIGKILRESPIYYPVKPPYYK